jgi:hypothetical protein
MHQLYYQRYCDLYYQRYSYEKKSIFDSIFDSIRISILHRMQIDSKKHLEQKQFFLIYLSNLLEFELLKHFS